VLLPAVLHGFVVDWLDEPALEIAWPIALTADLALSYFFARLIFGKHPVIPVVLLIGIASNACAFLAIALFHPTEDFRPGRGVLLFAAALAIAIALRRARVRSFWPYLVFAGGASWFAFFTSGLHPALALVPIMPFLPHAPRDPGFFVDADPNAPDALSRFEVWWRMPAQMALFFFGLVNAGVPFHSLEAGTWGLPLAVIVGRPIGLMIGTGIALAAGLHLPHHVGWRELLVVGFTVAIGFSVGLFASAALLPPGQLLAESSMGAILTLIAAPLAFLAARLLRVGRFGSAT